MKGVKCVLLLCFLTLSFAHISIIINHDPEPHFEPETVVVVGDMGVIWFLKGIYKLREVVSEDSFTTRPGGFDSGVHDTETFSFSFGQSEKYPPGTYHYVAIGGPEALRGKIVVPCPVGQTCPINDRREGFEDNEDDHNHNEDDGHNHNQEIPPPQQEEDDHNHNHEEEVDNHEQENDGHNHGQSPIARVQDAKPNVFGIFLFFTLIGIIVWVGTSSYQLGRRVNRPLTIHTA
eukprot:TRINITY_DN2958_c0_g1_i1.p1 TRINITY_DN2958_c0_g1~~TRINITY_DN2958_c0_g1_i1.p1  ORF type:complete len:246 (-),score=61.31 TRINITY_DN2958_c0_g1_i1:35-733(-)